LETLKYKTKVSKVARIGNGEPALQEYGMVRAGGLAAGPGMRVSGGVAGAPNMDDMNRVSASSQSGDGEEYFPMAKVREMLGLTDGRVLVFARGFPSMLNPYSSAEGARMSRSELEQLRQTLFKELESCLHARPDHVVRLLGSKSFIDAYHDHAGKKTPRAPDAA
jgi:hypothetical protein